MRLLNDEERVVFDIYFPCVVSMARHHPGAGRTNGYNEQAPKLSLEQCADEAIEMIRIRSDVFERTVNGYYKA